MQVLDLRPPEITVKFSKGSTFNPIFFYLGKDNAVIDMTGYTARMQARASPVSPEVLLELTTENGGLVIVTGDTVDSNGTVIPQAQGLQLYLSSVDTSALPFSKVIFGLEITTPTGMVSTMVMGVLEATREIVK